MGAERKAWLGLGQENGGEAWLKVRPSSATLQPHPCQRGCPWPADARLFWPQPLYTWHLMVTVLPHLPRAP